MKEPTIHLLDIDNQV